MLEELNGFTLNDDGVKSMYNLQPSTAQLLTSFSLQTLSKWLPTYAE
jgi:hypothetical protein